MGSCANTASHSALARGKSPAAPAMRARVARSAVELGSSRSAASMSSAARAYRPSIARCLPRTYRRSASDSVALPGVGPATAGTGTGLGSVISRSTATSVIGGRCSGATRDGGIPGGGTGAEDFGGDDGDDDADGTDTAGATVEVACAATAYALTPSEHGTAASTTHACVSTRSRRDRRATADGRIRLTSFSPRPWIQPWPLP